MKIKSRFTLKVCSIGPQNQQFRPKSVKMGRFPSFGRSIIFVLVGSRGSGLYARWDMHCHCHMRHMSVPGSVNRADTKGILTRRGSWSSLVGCESLMMALPLLP